MKLGGFMVAQGGIRCCQARFKDDPELQHELVHPCSPGRRDIGDVAGLAQGLEDLSLRPRGESQDPLGRKWHLYTREGYSLSLNLADLSQEGSQLAVKRPGSRPIQPFLNHECADR